MPLNILEKKMDDWALRKRWYRIQFICINLLQLFNFHSP
jgi:hypothetical protein